VTTRIIHWMRIPLTLFLRLWEVIPSTKLDNTYSQKKIVLSVILLGTSMRLWILLTDQKTEVKNCSV
jgi:hypothetical protein